MKKEATRAKFKSIIAAMASSYGVTPDDVKESFAVTEPMETKLNSAIQDSSEFLQRITMMGVIDKHGQSINPTIQSTLAKRTNTSSNDRVPTTMGGPTGLSYECALTEFDVAFDYSLLDAWARFDNFEQLYMDAVYNRIALDRILTGFNGTQAAEETNRATNPLLQDVNIGWIELLKTKTPENYLTESTAASGKITIGSGGDYKNLDQLTFDIYSMIGSANRTYGEVAIVGRALVANDMGKALAAFGQRPTEKAEIQVLDKSYGSLPSLVVPGFPDNGLLVTDPKNLHLYYQENGTRRQAVNYPKRNQTQDYISSNDAYTLGNKNGIAGIDASKVEFVDS